MRRLCAVLGVILMALMLLVPTAPSATAATSHHRGKFTPPLPYSTTYQTYNWAGYIVNSASYYGSVSAEWKVPTLYCGQYPYSDASLWVGEGGWDQGDDLIQTGLDLQCYNGTAYYQGFAELIKYGLNEYPPSIVGGAVYPGDEVQAVVWYEGNSTFQTQLYDWTQGWSSISTVVANPSSSRTGEWIAERPCNDYKCTTQPALADFGTVTMDSVVVDGSAFAYYSPGSIEAIDLSGNEVIGVSGIFNDDSFIAGWANYG